MNLQPEHPLRRHLRPLLLATGLVLTGFGVAVAGDHGPRDPVAKMAEKLELDAAQKASVEALFERNQPARKALRERHREHAMALRALDPSAPDFTTRAQALADQAADLARDRVLMHTQMQAEMAAVLTSEQMDQMKQWRGKRHGHWHGKRSRHGEHAPDRDSTAS